MIMRTKYKIVLFLSPFANIWLASRSFFFIATLSPPIRHTEKTREGEGHLIMNGVYNGIQCLRKKNLGRKWRQHSKKVRIVNVTSFFLQQIKQRNDLMTSIQQYFLLFYKSLMCNSQKIKKMSFYWYIKKTMIHK
jgi:hypothetical protein